MIQTRLCLGCGRLADRYRALVVAGRRLGPVRSYCGGCAPAGWL